MTPERQRIVIALVSKLDRFQPLRYATRGGRLLPVGETGVRLMYCEGGTNGFQDWEDVPDYLNDLNAMHRAIQHARENYRDIENDPFWCDGQFSAVANIVLERNHWDDDVPLMLIEAPQYAEIFLRTLGKWEETTP